MDSTIPSDSHAVCRFQADYWRNLCTTVRLERNSDRLTIKSQEGATGELEMTVDSLEQKIEDHKACISDLSGQLVDKDAEIEVMEKHIAELDRH